MKTNGHRAQASARQPDRTVIARRRLTRFKRLLRQHLPELRTRYGVKSLGVFGSYVRGQARPRSDLDVLVEFGDTRSLMDFIALQNDLSELLGIKVDLVPRENLKPFIGKRILNEVVWLSQARNPQRPHSKKSGTHMTPKREYLDSLNDILQAMDKAERYVSGKTFEDLLREEILFDALSKAVENIGEAVKHIPANVRNRYPQINWKKMAGMRDHLAHGYFSIDPPTLWETATVYIPHDKPLVADALGKELERRADEK